MNLQKQMITEGRSWHYLKLSLFSNKNRDKHCFCWIEDINLLTKLYYFCYLKAIRGLVYKWYLSFTEYLQWLNSNLKYLYFSVSCIYSVSL